MHTKKSTGVCCHCLAVRKLHLKDGNVHIYGFRRKPCVGSRQPLLSTTGNTVVPELTQSVLGATGDYSESDINADDVDTTHDDKPKHPRQLGGRILKHIPKGARFACSKGLTSIILAICENPERVVPWRELLWFTSNVLGQPPRAGRRRNLANIIKKRLDRRDQQHTVDALEGLSDNGEHKTIGTGHAPSSGQLQIRRGQRAGSHTNPL